MASKRRALHFVLKIANMKNNLEFFRDKLGMKVLRHEVFEKGCEAACNGPYDGKWSKTMIGYGPEDNHFVIELTYNYSIGKYRLGNDLRHIEVSVNQESYERISKQAEDRDSAEEKETNDDEVKKIEESLTLNSPDGYKFIISKTVSEKQDVVEVCLGVTDLKRSLNFWTNVLAMPQYGDSKQESHATLRYSEKQATLRLVVDEDGIEHKTAYGRIAFSCESSELQPIQKSVEEAEQKVLTPLLSLDTPGKATVQVVIVADPDGHEICFVGDQGFRELSQVDEKADELIEKSIVEDKSEEWFHKKKIMKKEADK